MSEFRLLCKLRSFVCPVPGAGYRGQSGSGAPAPRAPPHGGPSRPRHTCAPNSGKAWSQKAKTKEKSRLVLRDGSHRFGRWACALRHPSGPVAIPCRENQVCRGPNSASRSTKSAVTEQTRKSPNRAEFEFVRAIFYFLPEGLGPGMVR